MKKRLNILCLLVMLVLGYSVYETTVLAIGAAADGLKKRQSLSDTEQCDADATANELLNLRPIALRPDDFSTFSDSVYNERSGAYAPAMHIQMLVLIQKKSDLCTSITIQLFSLLFILVALQAIVLFTKLIIAINQSNIFCWKNVYRLRWIGGYLILGYLSLAIPSFITDYQLSEVFALRGYSLHQMDLTSTTTLVLGIVSLIVAEVFAIGLKMKEEQDLTI